MISKLPRWVESGAFVLALVAGCINAIGFLGFDHQAVSHLSGTATLFGSGLLNNSLVGSLHLFGILLAFFLGAVIAGFLLHGSTLKLGRHYDTALMILAAFGLLANGSLYGQFFASAACGLQNALATTYSGAIVRTTHVTGIFTDLGIMFGSIFRGEALDTRKAKLFILIISGFVAGGTVGALLFEHLRFMALLFPAICCVLLAGVYRLYSRKLIARES